jgi:hypothetical protein
MSLADAITAVVEAIAMPYGYTLTIWAAGMLAVERYKYIKVEYVLLFVLGAVLGYLAFDLVAFGAVSDEESFPVRLPSVAILNILPVMPALLTALLIRRIPWPRVGFPAMGFAATVFYILAMSLLFWAIV